MMCGTTFIFPDNVAFLLVSCISMTLHTPCSSRKSGSCLFFFPHCSAPSIHLSVPLNPHSEISPGCLYCSPSPLLLLFAIASNATMHRPLYMLFHIWEVYQTYGNGLPEMGSPVISINDCTSRRCHQLPPPP